jgi:hypothetical protein
MQLHLLRRNVCNASKHLLYCVSQVRRRHALCALLGIKPDGRKPRCGYTTPLDKIISCRQDQATNLEGNPPP